MDLEEYTSSVLGFISRCADDVAITRTVTCFPNQKPWLNAEVRALLKARDAAFRAGEASALKVPRKELTAGIARAKATYARKIQDTSPPMTPGACGRALSASWIITPGMHNAQGTPPYQMHSTGSTLAFEDPDSPPPALDLYHHPVTRLSVCP